MTDRQRAWYVQEQDKGVFFINMTTILPVRGGVGYHRETYAESAE